jgi:HEAT repeat protein
MALKMLADPVSLPTLLRLIADTDESPRARAFALNGLGQIGDLSATRPIIDYLLNHQNPYRDSASWSLQMLGKIAMSKAPELAAHLKNVYMQALLRETDDIEGRYAKGNIIYSLGIMRATEFTDQILEWIMTQKDDYVLEDAINAIGNLGEYRASNILISFVNWNDPVVRMKAANALGEIGYCEAIPDLENLIDDPFPIVRETAKKAIDKLRNLAK